MNQSCNSHDELFHNQKLIQYLPKEICLQCNGSNVGYTCLTYIFLAWIQSLSNCYTSIEVFFIKCFEQCQANQNVKKLQPTCWRGN
jgi:hypothetical protein